jgi:hypothetical protein
MRTLSACLLSVLLAPLLFLRADGQESRALVLDHVTVVATTGAAGMLT